MRIATALSALITAVLLSGCSSASPENRMVIDNAGRFVFKPDVSTYLGVPRKSMYFVEGKTAVGTDNLRRIRQRYVDLNGKYLPEEYDCCHNFSDGMAAVEPECDFNSSRKIDHKIGFVDGDTKLVIAPQYAEVTKFREGFCPVRPIGQPLWGVIDRTGKLVVAPQFDGAQVFSNGLLPVQKDKLWGYVNAKGDFAFRPSFLWANCFHDGLALVAFPGKMEKWACIRPNGEIAFECRSDKLSDNAYGRIVQNSALFDLRQEYQDDQYACGFSDGRLRFTKDDKYGFYDTSGKVVIPAQFDYADNFSEGKSAVVTFKSSKATVSYIDKQGKVVIDGKFDSGRPFHEGKAAVKGSDGKWFYIDANGKLALEGKFDSARSFHDGRAIVNYEPSEPK